MDIESYISEKSRLVNSALDSLLPKEEDFPQALHKAMRYSVFAGGKRLRPILTLAGCAASGGNIEDALNTACAVECIHTYSLIHDDLPAIDNDDLRRGKPSCHKAFGEATAILAGDALLTIAFDMIAGTPHAGKKNIVRVVKELSHAAGHAGMIGGQVLDIASENTEVSFPVIQHIHIHKTGALIVASVRSGAILAGADGLRLERLTHYAESLGLCFQIIDDILDVEGTSEALGKTAGSDEKRKKATYPAIAGLKESKEMAEELKEKALSHLSGFGESAAPLRALAQYIVERKR